MTDLPNFSHAPQPVSAAQHVAATPPPVPADLAEAAALGGDDLVSRILRGMNPSTQQTAFDTLIANARKGLGVEGFSISTGDEEEGIVVDALDPIVANELLALISDGKAQMKQIDARVKEAETVLKEAIVASGGNTLKVSGVTVATYKQSADSRVLDAAQIKALFPDTPENKELWKTQPGSMRFLLK